MNIKIILGAIVGAIALAVGAYFFGFSVAQTEGELKLENLKKAQAEAIVAAQSEVKKDYEKKIAALSADLERVRAEHNNRLQQLAKFRATSRDLQTCHDERNRLATIAVGLEEVADRAITRLESMTAK